MAEEFERLRFDRVARAGTSILDAADLLRIAPSSILEIGCGSGATLLDLAKRFPQAELYGIDVAPENIDVALGDARSGGVDDRVHLAVGDYREAWPELSHELLIAESVLYLLPGSDSELYDFIAARVAAGGHLVMTMPTSSPSNRSLVLLRRLLRHLPHRAVLWVGRSIAARLHSDVTAADLEQRLPYLFVVPRRLDGPALRADLGRRGLDVVHEVSLPRASPAQLRHDLVVFRKSR